MESQFEYDVFLSHNSADKPMVRQLAERLRDAGLRVWFDEWVIKPGDDIYLAIERGLEAARVQLLCLSPSALDSDWVTMERNTVLFRNPTNDNRRFIPLLLDDCKLPDALSRFKYVDFREETQTALDELLIACRAGTVAGRSDRYLKDVPKKETQKHPKNLKGKTQAQKSAPAKPQDESKQLAVLEFRLEGHTNWVESVAVSSDGAWMTSGSKDKTVRIWDLETGTCKANLEGHTDSVDFVTISSDRKQILSGSLDRSLCVWDAQGMELSFRFDEPRAGVSGIALFSKGRRAISCESETKNDSMIRIWDLETNKLLHSFDPGHTSYVCSVDITDDGRNAVSSSGDSTIKFWKLSASGNVCLAVGKDHTGGVTAVRITENGRLAVSSSYDRTVKVWDMESGTCVGTLEGHQDHVLSVALSPNGLMVASAGFTDGTIRVWDLDAGVCLQVIQNADPISPISVAFSPDGSRLVVGMVEGAIYVYRLATICPKRWLRLQKARTKGRAIRLRQLLKSRRRYVNAKVVLLGEGAVGKTSLAHRLLGDEYVVTDRTHGMNVWPLELPLPPDDTREREVLLWDLAGQEDYRLIHRLFLDETALALLLINPQKDDPFAEAGDWLKALETATRNHDSKRKVERLLVFSQIDVGGMKISDAKIDRFVEEHGFVDWLATSAKTGEHCSDGKTGGPSELKQLIAEHIPWDRLPWTSTPRRLAALKEAVMTMRDTADIRLLRFAELEQRLKQVLPDETFGESEVRTAVTLLGNHGLARALQFGDLVLLRPELVNSYAGAIIRAARADKDEIGCVSEAAIYDRDFDFTGVERLPRSDEELLLRYMVQTFLDHSLCIAEDTPQGRHLVFPSQYRREKDIPKDPDTFVSYTFRGEWQTVWTTLVVRLWYSQEFEHRELWRNAAEFQSSRGQLLGMKIENRQGEGEATISLFFDVKTPDELKVIFIEYVHRHLAKYGCDVTRDRRYVCGACEFPVTNLDAVRRRFAAGKDFITCQECDEMVPLFDFIEQRIKSDPVARRILAMEETATRELDTQSMEQILIGHIQATTGEAGQIFRELTKFDHGIDGEVEFKDDYGKASGKKIYVQLKHGNSYLRTRKKDGAEVFDVKNDHHLEYWVNQPVDVYLVIRQTEERSNESTIRWMNVTRYLKERKDKDSRQIIFEGEELTMQTVWRLRDEFFPPGGGKVRQKSD